MERLRRVSMPGLYDRHPAVSELVYRTALKEPFLMMPWFLYRWLARRDDVIVYCRPTDEALEKAPLAVRPHKPLEYVEKLIRRRRVIIDLYDDLMECLKTERCTILEYDYEADPNADGLMLRLTAEAMPCAD